MHSPLLTDGTCDNVQVKKLKRMKETLADNISSLFKTAAAEIARKDGQNKELSARFRAGRRASAQRQLVTVMVIVFIFVFYPLPLLTLLDNCLSAIAVQGSSSLHFHKSNKGQQGRH